MLKILYMDSIEWFHTPCKKCYYIGYDLFFANNANIVFKTPEEVFFNSEQMFI